MTAHPKPATAMFTAAAGNRLIADVFGEVGAPVLLLHGGGQTRHAWRKTLAPHAEYADVSGARHMVVGDRNDQFSAAILAFLRRH
jgi:pimeloyl-ACP methyl ester carboxylesterase